MLFMYSFRVSEYMMFDIGIRTRDYMLCSINDYLIIWEYVLLIYSQTRVYRQSIDLYGSVPSPSINFLGPQSLSQLGSSFLSSSLIRRHTPEILPSLSKPLIPSSAEAEKPKESRSSRYLPSPSLSRKSSLRKAVLDKRASVANELSGRHSSYGQAVLNGLFLSFI